MARVAGGRTAAEVVPGIHRWTARHPEWRPGREEVVSWALEAEDRLLLVDPLLPKKGDEAHEPLLAYLDDLAGPFDKLEILITIPYHTRSSEPLFERYWGRMATRIWGQPNVADRFFYDTKLTEVPRTKGGASVPIVDGLVEAYTIGNPRRLETPYYVPEPEGSRLRRRHRRSAGRPAGVGAGPVERGLVQGPLPPHAPAARRAAGAQHPRHARAGRDPGRRRGTRRRTRRPARA